ncbi:hypothetical protein FR943_24600 [Mycobacterium sp. TNTM28]|uniref:DUF7847 domain-containing protein n=2 Tax=[Mycobacterium] fortunisiensis TaxID=2600579 RepID=A0ABS6KUA3_9MYCO|nr:hypothetical protein [[Mycobacterium] fortunisiensis]
MERMVIPLRPLSLTDIFNGAVAYIRANPKATLGLAAVVVIAAQVVELALRIGPLSALGEFNTTVQGETPSVGSVVVFAGGALTGIVVTTLSSLLLSGMLTVVIGRSVFGGTVTIGAAWQRLRGRLPALIGLTALEALALVLVVVGLTLPLVAVAAVGGAVIATVLGIPLLLLTLAGVLYASTVLLFAPAVIVLEQRGIVAAIRRSFTLVSKDFWRVFGIWILSAIVAAVIAWGVGAPFNIAGQIMSLSGPGLEAGPTVPALVLSAIGAAIGQIVTAPFSAGVVVLLYTDRRFRSEAFDLLLQTGGVGPVETTDQLWLPRYA